ncbi:hypothetical protein [Marinoscillum sp. MHG1-6]|uniref:hypothetical protein n=1 Tax=Marinoscillum sp. MHG1-6 TaxID=2959627 RepID=UPI0021580E28|nr:hypothetical protein [Marinoscillum sp. MHG1-6]
MKRNILILTIGIFFCSCGGGSSSQAESTESDEEIATEIIESIEEEKAELATSTEEAINEVDSLLENL